MIKFIKWLSSFFFQSYPVVQIIYTIKWHDENNKPLGTEKMQILLKENRFGYRTYRYFEPKFCAREKKGLVFGAGYEMWKTTNLQTQDIDWSKFFPNCEIVLLKKQIIPAPSTKEVVKSTLPGVTQESQEPQEKTIMSEMRF